MNEFIQKQHNQAIYKRNFKFEAIAVMNILRNQSVIILIEFIIIAMENNIKAIDFRVEEVGKHIKNSKKRYTWTFSLDQKLHTLTLDASILSGKMKVTLDSKTLVETQVPAGQAFQYPFTQSGYNLNVIQQSDTFDFRINNKVFSHLFNQERTNNAFKKAQDSINQNDFNADPNTFQAKGSMKVNISCINVKKKQNAVSENWNQLSKSSFPNYFGQDQSTNEVKVQKVQQSQDLLGDDTASQTQTTKFNSNANQQDYSTMQMLFATQAGLKQTNIQDISKMDPNQFNTMQQLFATQNPQQNLNVSAFGAEEMSKIQQIFATQNPKNAEEFNTMQQLFTTQNLSQQKKLPTIKEEEFNTMQQIFATQNPGSQNIEQSNNGVFDFNAMQKALSTQNPKGNLQKIEQSKIGIGNLETTKQLYQTQAGQQIPNTQDFNTMQNLFATCNGQNNKVQASILKFNNADQQQQVLNAQNFNTMQFLFATNAAQMMGAKQNQPLSEQVNNQDFSTMANLFKTNNLHNTTNGTENNAN